MLFKLGLFMIVISCITMYYLLQRDGSLDPQSQRDHDNQISENDSHSRMQNPKTNFVAFGEIHLVVVACGDRLSETLIMIKSAIILTPSSVLNVHIFAEMDLHMGFKTSLEKWPEKVKQKLVYHLRPITFPKGKENEWKKLFKPCASQRLFLPEIMQELDSILYVDTDILFLRPIDDVWEHFKKFNERHISALAPEHEEPSAGWYNRFARHPYYGPLGVNSGVMLMNLTRIRQDIPWLHLVEKYYNEYKLQITWGDQDIINIIFHYHPEKLYIYGCEWNYRPDHCMYMSVCENAEKKGVSVLHGNRGVYHNEKQPVFRAIYEAYRDYNFEENLETGLIDRIETNMKKAAPSNCGNLHHIFTKQLKQHTANKTQHM